MGQSRLQLMPLLLALASCAPDRASEERSTNDVLPEMGPASAAASSSELPAVGANGAGSSSPAIQMGGREHMAIGGAGGAPPPPAGAEPSRPTAVSGADAGDARADAVEAPDGARVFASDVLHVIDITVERAHLAQLESDLENRVPCTFSYDGTTVAQAGIRKKGNSTLRPLIDKPSFSVNLDEFVEDAEIDGTQKFILNNSVKDPTYLSEPLAFLVYRRAGVPVPKTALAVVRFNGWTKGIYLVEPGVNKRFLRNAYGDGSGNLYEGPWDFTQSVADADLKDEDEGRSREDLSALQTAVVDSSDAELLSALDPRIDVDEMVTTIAVDMAMCLWDGYTVTANNFYLYHVPGERFVMLPHGHDWPWWVADVDPLRIEAFRPWGRLFPHGLLALRLVEVAPDRYAERLQDVRDRAFDLEALNALIDEFSSVVHSADTRNPVLAAAVASFDLHVGEARAFVADRRAFLEQAL